MKYALITGASKGIGKAIVEELAARKINLLLVARSEDLLQTLAMDLQTRFGIKADCLAIDLAQEHAAEQVFQWTKDKGYTVNILINNAGYGLSGQFEKYSPDDYTQMMQVNMTVPVLLTNLFIPELKRNTPSYILNIASSAVPGLTVYAASKAFVLSFSRGLAFELRKSGVSVTAVSPGGTDTDFANRAQVGAKAVRAGEKLNMTAEAVAKLAVDAMLAKKTEIITGFVNKLGAFLVWLLPKKLTETTASGIYNNG